MTSAKTWRLALRKSRAWCAAMAGVSEPSARLFEETDGSMLTGPVRTKLEAFYARLKAEAEAGG